MAIWADEITLIAQTEPAERLDANGFPNELVRQKQPYTAIKSP